jgi:hypothetical protein
VSEDSDASPRKKKNVFAGLYRSSSTQSTSELDLFLADSTKKNFVTREKSFNQGNVFEI